MYWAPKIHKEAIGALLLLSQKSAVQTLFQKQFLRLLNLSSIKYNVSTINHVSIFHLNLNNFRL